MLKKKNNSIPKLNRTVIMLGFVSLFMDSSSEMIHALLPLFFIQNLGLSMSSIGIIEGIAETTALITKTFSGVISDSIGKRKILILAGYSLAALSKPFFAFSSSGIMISFARIADRIGKGIRGAPRDALIADVTPPEIKGKAFGLRQSMDSIGAIIGPVIAFALYTYFSVSIINIFLFAIIPAVFSVGIILFFIKDKKEFHQKQDHDLRKWKNLPRTFWIICLAGFAFTFSRFNEAFLLLRANDIFSENSIIPLTLIIMNVTYALSAYPAGSLSDHLGKFKVATMGIFFLICSNFLLSLNVTPLLYIISISLWGLHMGFTQGVFSALISNTVQRNFQGTAFGIYAFFTGAALLLSGITGGLIWENFGSVPVFQLGVLAGSSSLIFFIPFFFTIDP